MQCLLRLQQLYLGELVRRACKFVLFLALLVLKGNLIFFSYLGVIPRKKHMVCMALITKGNNSLSVPIIIDGGCEVDLVLNMGDVEKLGTKFTRHGAARLGAGKEVVSLAKYGEVTVRIFFQNNAFVEAEITPAVFEVDEEEQFKGSNEIESETYRVPGARLLGYPGLNRMGLIQDFDQHCLYRTYHLC